MRIILHIDFNSYFASVEQQANPRLRGKPVGVTGGDRLKRTVLGAASVEAKRYGVKTGMQIWEAKKLCPEIIIVPGDSDKYLETTKRFLNILKDFSSDLEVFSIDEVFLELSPSLSFWQTKCVQNPLLDSGVASAPQNDISNNVYSLSLLAMTIKQRIKAEVGEWMKCSIGISYNKLMAKLASSLQKRDGLVVIPDQQEAIKILDKIELDEICGIGSRIKKRLNNMGVFNFKDLRNVPLAALLASFKSYGQVLYDMSRGIDNSSVIPFYEKEEVKSVGHRHTIDTDSSDPEEIKQILLKLTELVARRLRAKKLVGKTVSCWYRSGTQGVPLGGWQEFSGDGMQVTIPYTSDGLEIFKAAWGIFQKIWERREIRMIGVSISNLKPTLPQTLSLLPETSKQETIIKTLDKINDKYGEFTLQRGILLGSTQMRRKANPFLADRRFKL